MNGVSAARRTRVNPADCRILESRPSPACAPSPNPTSCDKRSGRAEHRRSRVKHAPDRIQIVLELVVGERLDDHPGAVGIQRLRARGAPRLPDRPCRAGNRRTPRSHSRCLDIPSRRPPRISRDRKRLPWRQPRAPARLIRDGNRTPRNWIWDTPAPSESWTFPIRSRRRPRAPPAFSFASVSLSAGIHSLIKCAR